MSQRGSRRVADRDSTLTDSLLSDAPAGQTVAQYSTRRGRRNRSRRTRKGKKIATIDAAWYVFDSLTEVQAEMLLKNHGSLGNYLLSQYDNCNNYRLSFISAKTAEEHLYRHFDIICNSLGWFTVKGLQNAREYASVEEAVQQVAISVQSEGLTLTPIFHECEDSGKYLISPDAVDIPPQYTEAKRYPNAPQRRLPVVLRPTLRRLNILSTNSVRRQNEEVPPSPAEEAPSGCWYCVWHTDPDGSWYKPHKAGCLTAMLLILGWLFFLILFGWIILIALVLVTILILFAATINFLCTGRCELGDNDDDNDNDAVP